MSSTFVELFAEIISENPNLDDSGISLPAFPSITSLKLYNIPVTDKTVKKVITDLDSSKAPGLEYIPVVFLKNYGSELPFILAGVVSMLLKESVLQMFEIAICCPKYESSVARNHQPVRLRSVISKILEKLVNNRLLDQLKKNEVFQLKVF